MIFSGPLYGKISSLKFKSPPHPQTITKLSSQLGDFLSPQKQFHPPKKLISRKNLPLQQYDYTPQLVYMKAMYWICYLYEEYKHRYTPRIGNIYHMETVNHHSIANYIQQVNCSDSGTTCKFCANYYSQILQFIIRVYDSLYSAVYMKYIETDVRWYQLY